MSLLYLGYIDDIFMTYVKAQKLFIALIKALNKKHETINFDFQISPKEINFSTTVLSKDENSRIRKTLVANPQINKHTYTINHNIQDL